MRILVTGTEGQVSRSIAEKASGSPSLEIIRVGRPDLDLLNPDSIISTVLGARPDIVVSAAAYTAVDQAEDEPERAFAVNATGAGVVAEAARRVGASIIHLSTDFVFSGRGEGEHSEADVTEPLSVYGRSKLEGERQVAQGNPRHVILRTAWVYSPFGRNFMKTMLKLASERDVIKVVSDQRGNPTAAADIAEGVLRVASRISGKADTHPYGIFHMSGEGDTSWAGFAKQIFLESERVGGPSANVEEISSAEFPTKAVRPANSRLSCAKLLDAYGWRPPSWRTSTAAVVARLVASTDVPAAR
ncbi:MAG: dTDP-4-dehydrorhamnose reductase [Rhizobiaceae bacterium]|nr:dTDP-4-dehydrorhamnose reductase [Rhizobiaceae bacterium]